VPVERPSVTDPSWARALVRGWSASTGADGSLAELPVLRARASTGALPGEVVVVPAEA
jgi:hypothetical protein